MWISAEISLKWNIIIGAREADVGIMFEEPSRGPTKGWISLEKREEAVLLGCWIAGNSHPKSVDEKRCRYIQIWHPQL